MKGVIALEGRRTFTQRHVVNLSRKRRKGDPRHLGGEGAEKKYRKDEERETSCPSSFESFGGIRQRPRANESKKKSVPRFAPSEYKKTRRREKRVRGGTRGRVFSKIPGRWRTRKGDVARGGGEVGGGWEDPVRKWLLGGEGYSGSLLSPFRMPQ